MSVVIRIACPCNIVLILEANQSLHRVWRRTVHSNLAIPIDRHESKCRIYVVTHDGNRHVVLLRDHRPVENSSAAEWVHTKLELGATDCIEVEHRAEIADVRTHVIMLVRRCGTPRALERDALYALQSVGEEFIRLVLDPAGDCGISRPAVCWRVSIAIIDHHRHIVCSEYFQRRGECRGGQCMCIDTEKQWAVCTGLFAIQAYRLCYREDVVLIECGIERRASMSRCSKDYSLRGNTRIRDTGVVRRHQARNVYKNVTRSRLAGQWADTHNCLAVENRAKTGAGLDITGWFSRVRRSVL